MKAPPEPRRLMHDPEIGDLVRNAGRRKWTTERLLHNDKVITQKLNAYTAGLASEATSMFGTGTLKVGLSLLVGGLIVGTLIWRPIDAPNLGNEPAGQEAIIVEPPELESESTEKPLLPAPVEKSTPEPSLMVQEKPSPRKVARRAPSQPESTNKSTLPAQLRLYQTAKSKAERGDHAMALKILSEMEQKYPDGPLAPDIRLARIEYLTAAGHFKAARDAIRDLLASPSPTARKSLLLRLEGDLWLREGNCSAASLAYRRALGFGLSPEEAELARAGLEKCGER